MNPQVFQFALDDEASEALGYLIALGISGAPVLDKSGRPVGSASFRELARAGDGATLADCMVPAITVPVSATLHEAGALLSERRVHSMIAVDDAGHAEGMVSAVDLVRALVGLPPSHPETFPEIDRSRGIVWSEELPLDQAHATEVADGPGVLVLMVGGANKRETPIWVEAASNLRARLDDLINLPQANPRLQQLLAQKGSQLRFKAAAISEPEQRKKLLKQLSSALESWWEPRKKAS